MADPAVVTELVVTSDNSGAEEYTKAMAAAQLAAAAAMAANDNLAASMRTANDNARDSANSNGLVSYGLKQAAQTALDAAEAYAKHLAVSAAVVGVLGLLAGTLIPIYTAYRLMKAAVDLVTEAWDLGNAKLREYIDLAKKALDSGLSTEFFQRISKGADDAKMPVDALQSALSKINEVTADKLGGSAGQNRLNELTEAGNFRGNTGVAALGSATTTEERFRAIVSLIDQAMQKGERLAALDVSKTFLGDAATVALAKDQDYLNKMLASADKIKSTDLISDVDVGNALLLQSRLDAAEKILSQRWHPIQDILTNLGIAMKGAWVNIVESMAGAVDWAAKLVEKLNGVPSKFWDYIQGGAKSFSDFTGSLGLNANPEDVGIKVMSDTDRAILAARQRADALLRNPANIESSQQSVSAIVRGVFPDQSKDPNAKQPQAPDTSAYDRAEESLLKYIEVTKAAAVSTGQGVEEQERLRAIAQLTAAGLKDGLTPEAAKAKAEMSGLADQAGNAALALAKARIASEIKFSHDTALLSPEDVQIAQQLRGIYPDVATALNSVEAQAIRANNSLREMSDLGQEMNRGWLVDFETGIRNGKTEWDSFRDAGVNALGKISDKLAAMAADNLWKAAFGGTSGSGLGSIFGGLFGGGSSGAVGVTGAAGGMVVPTFFHDGGLVGAGGSQRGAFPTSIFHGAPRFHLGVDEVPAILQAGERVIPRGQNDNGRDRGTAPTAINININVSGARGNQEIQDMVQQGVSSGLNSFVKSPRFPQAVQSASVRAAKTNFKG